MTSPQRKKVKSRCPFMLTTFEVHRRRPEGSGGDDDPVLHRGPSGRRPRSPLRLLPLRPGADHSFQADLGHLHLDRNPLRIERSAKLGSRTSSSLTTALTLWTRWTDSSAVQRLFSESTQPLSVRSRP